MLLECIGDGTSTSRTDVVVPEIQSGDILVETRRRDQFSDGTSLDTHCVLLECIGDGTSTFRTDVVVPETQSGEILVETRRRDQFSDGTSLDTHRVLLECIGDGTSTFRTDVVVVRYRPFRTDVAVVEVQEVLRFWWRHEGVISSATEQA